MTSSDESSRLFLDNGRILFYLRSQKRTICLGEVQDNRSSPNDILSLRSWNALKSLGPFSSSLYSNNVQSTKRLLSPPYPASASLILCLRQAYNSLECGILQRQRTAETIQ